MKKKIYFTSSWGFKPEIFETITIYKLITYTCSHGRKRAKKIAAGKLAVSEESIFDAFRVATTIHGRYYSESHAMLGQTYGMCVLQV